MFILYIFIYFSLFILVYCSFIENETIDNKNKKIEIPFSEIIGLKNDLAFQEDLIKKLESEGFDFSEEITFGKNCITYTQKTEKM